MDFILRLKYNIYNLETYFFSGGGTVETLSEGRLGYVHIRGMDSQSFRELFDKALGKLHKKEALIVDTRFNGGG